MNIHVYQGQESRIKFGFGIKQYGKEVVFVACEVLGTDWAMVATFFFFGGDGGDGGLHVPDSGGAEPETMKRPSLEKSRE